MYGLETTGSSFPTSRYHARKLVTKMPPLRFRAAHLNCQLVQVDLDEAGSRSTMPSFVAMSEIVGNASARGL